MYMLIFLLFPSVVNDSFFPLLTRFTGFYKVLVNGFLLPSITYFK